MSHVIKIWDISLPLTHYILIVLLREIRGYTENPKWVQSLPLQSL